MSYPYGPEAYPTIEQTEDCDTLNEIRAIYGYERHKLASTLPEADAWGLAFGRALQYVMDWDETDLSRFAQDFFCVLEDKVISKSDKESQEFGDNAYSVAQLKRIREDQKDNNFVKRMTRLFPSEYPTEESARAYYQSEVDRLEKEIESFRLKKIEEIERRCSGLGGE